MKSKILLNFLFFCLPDPKNRKKEKNCQHEFLRIHDLKTSAEWNVEKLGFVDSVVVVPEINAVFGPSEKPIQVRSYTQ